jgi:hypothetical protein
MLYFITEGNFIRIKDGNNDFRLLHKTSNCINWTVTDKIDLSIDEFTFDQLEPSGISFDGVAASTADGVINSLKGMFTGLQAAKVYRALLTQSGTGAPVATVLENTVSNPLFYYSQVGNFLFTCNDILNTSKTNYDQPSYKWINISSVDQEATVRIERTNDNEITIIVRNDGSYSNDYLNGFYFELLIWD